MTSLRRTSPNSQINGVLYDFCPESLTYLRNSHTFRLKYLLGYPASSAAVLLSFLPADIVPSHLTRRHILTCTARVRYLNTGQTKVAILQLSAAISPPGNGNAQ